MNPSFCLFYSKYFKFEYINIFAYSPFHKTSPKSSLQVNWISVSFYEMAVIQIPNIFLLYILVYSWSLDVPAIIICLFNKKKPYVWLGSVFWSCRTTKVRVPHTPLDFVVHNFSVHFFLWGKKKCLLSGSMSFTPTLLLVRQLKNNFFSVSSLTDCAYFRRTNLNLSFGTRKEFMDPNVQHPEQPLASRKLSQGFANCSTFLCKLLERGKIHLS